MSVDGAESGTVGSLLRRGSGALVDAGSESPRLDAELLMAAALGVDRTTVMAHPEARPGTAQLAAYDAAIVRRAAGEPVAYIRGIKEFHGVALSVDRRALIPRPETELLVDLAETEVRAALSASPRPAGTPPFLIWDVGTGSGAIAIALALDLRRRGYGAAISLLATDVSPDALALAVENAVGHGVADVIRFAPGDLLETAERPAAVDLIVANLPYIPSAVVPTLPVAASFEPTMALDGGADGLDLVRRLLSDLDGVVAPNGGALLEIGADQSDAVLAAAAAALPDWRSSVHLDLADRPRVLQLQRAA